jgi:2-methylaconitate cis-trans-isomerase PrpF
MNARIFSMGKLHHAMTGTGAVAIAAAAVIPNTVVNTLVGSRTDRIVRFGHPSGSLAVGATVEMQNDSWVVTKVAMSRTAQANGRFDFRTSGVLQLRVRAASRDGRCPEISSV